MHKLSVLICSMALTLAAFITPLRADTTVFENGFYFITAPAEFEDVVVGAGATVAFLDGVVITGDLKVIDGGFVSANNCLIEGDVEASGAAIVDLLGATIGATSTSSEPAARRSLDCYHWSPL